MHLQENILDNFEEKEKELLSRMLLMSLLSLSIIFALADLLLILDKTPVIPKNESLFLGTKTKTGLFISFIHFILVPVACLLLSLIISLIPIRKRKYSKKYPSITIILMVFLQAFLLTLTLLNK